MLIRQATAQGRDRSAVVSDTGRASQVPSGDEKHGTQNSSAESAASCACAGEFLRQRFDRVASKIKYIFYRQALRVCGRCARVGRSFEIIRQRCSYMLRSTRLYAYFMMRSQREERIRNSARKSPEARNNSVPRTGRE